MALMLGSASPAPATSEQELIHAARVGDDRAFEELYSRYQGRIGIFIRSRVRDHSRAEDVAQEVFLSALRRLRSSDQKILFKPWIYEIAKNACIDEHRRSHRVREVSLDAGEEFSDGQSELRSIAPTPPAAMERKQQLDDLRGAFGGLSESHHQLLVMREFEGLSYGEIGRRTGMSRQMVESALFRARRKLGVEYDELASGRRCLQVQTAIEGGKLTSRHSLGVRERRQLARHLAHCQPCRVTAHLAGVDESFVRTGIAAKIAALLPFPALRWWPFGRAARAAAVRSGSHPGYQLAAGALEPSASALLGGAAVAVVALAISGSGGPAAAGTHHSVHPVKATTAAYTSAIASRQVATPREFAPGLGAVSGPGPRVNAAERLRQFSAILATPVPARAAHQGGSTPATSTRSGAGRSGSASATSETPIRSSVVAPAAPSLQRTVSGVQQGVGHTINSVGKTLGQTPVAKTVGRVLSTVPSASRSGSAGSASPPSGLPSALNTVGNVASSVVKSVTKTLGVGTLTGQH